MIPRPASRPQSHLASVMATTPKMLLVSISIPSDPETPPSAHSVDNIHGASVWNTELSRRKTPHRGGEWSSSRKRGLQDRRTPSPISSTTCRSGDSSS